MDIAGNKYLALAEYNEYGLSDSALGPDGILTAQIGGTSRAYALAVDSDSGILVVGRRTGEGGAGEFGMSRYVGTTSTADLTYDNNGNTLTDGSGNTYTYNAWNQMATATPSDSGTTYHETYYSYNALGERVSEFDGIASGVTTPVLVINDGNVQRSMIDSVTVVFDGPVTLSSGAITLTGETVGSIAISVTNPSGDDKTYLVTFTDDDELDSGSLPNDIFNLTLTAADISGAGAPGSNKTYTFHRLLGDIAGVGIIGSIDETLLEDAEGTSTGEAGYEWYIDLNHDGSIDSSDLGILLGDFGESYTYSNSNPILQGASQTQGVNSGTGTAALSPRYFYYSSQWQLIQENAADPESGGTQVADQYVWGQAYVNELVLRDANSTGSTSTGDLGISDSGLDQRVYVQQDANWNVTALISTSGTVLERYVYDPYGNVTVLNPDGTIKGNGTASASGYGMVYLYQGGRLDVMTGLYEFEHRDYNPVTGTWDQQDPTGYVTGADLYLYVRGNPERLTDPSGLSPDGGMMQPLDGTMQPQGTMSPIDQAAPTGAGSSNGPIQPGDPLWPISPILGSEPPLPNPLDPINIPPWQPDPIGGPILVSPPSFPLVPAGEEPFEPIPSSQSEPIPPRPTFPDLLRIMQPKKCTITFLPFGKGSMKKAGGSARDLKYDVGGTLIFANGLEVYFDAGNSGSVKDNHDKSKGRNIAHGGFRLSF